MLKNIIKVGAVLCAAIIMTSCAQNQAPNSKNSATPQTQNIVNGGDSKPNAARVPHTDNPSGPYSVNGRICNGDECTYSIYLNKERANDFLKEVTANILRTDDTSARVITVDYYVPPYDTPFYSATVKRGK